MEATATKRTYRQINEEMTQLRFRADDVQQRIKNAETAYKRFRSRGLENAWQTQVNKVRRYRQEHDEILVAQKAVEAEWEAIRKEKRNYEIRYLDDVVSRVSNWPAMLDLSEDHVTIERGRDELELIIPEKWNYATRIRVSLPRRASSEGDMDEQSYVSISATTGYDSDQVQVLDKVLGVAYQVQNMMDHEFVPFE